MTQLERHAYFRRLGGLLELDVNDIKARIVEKPSPVTGQKKLVQFSNESDMVQFVSDMLNRMGVSEVLLFLGDAFRFGPVHLPTETIKRRLPNLLKASEGIFSVQSTNIDFKFLVEIDDGSDETFDATVELYGSISSP